MLKFGSNVFNFGSLLAIKGRIIMINFSSFYQHIAQDERLFHWLDTLPAQLSEWRAHAFTWPFLLHGKECWKTYLRLRPLNLI